MTNGTDPAYLYNFIRMYRQAVLATANDGAPFTAMVSYAEEGVPPAVPDPDHLLAGASFLVHLSELSAHKRHLRANPRCSLLIAEPDPGRGDVMSLSRLSVQGVAALVPKATIEYDDAKARYLSKLPTSAMMFSLQDFDLFRIHVTGGRFIAGFGRVFNV